MPKKLTRKRKRNPLELVDETISLLNYYVGRDVSIESKSGNFVISGTLEKLKPSEGRLTLKRYSYSVLTVNEDAQAYFNSKDIINILEDGGALFLTIKD